MTHLPSLNPSLIPQLAAIDPALMIFDKDGTLIDFHAMWGGWATELARRLEAAIGRPIANRLFKAMGFDPSTGQILPSGHLAVSPMAELQTLSIDVLRAAGLSPQAAETAMAAAWHTPDPVALARPLTNLYQLFTTLHAHNAKIAIATSDDRSPTETMLAHLGVASLIDATVCADDGIPIKPAPDMILSICHQLNTPPAKAVMIGDNPDDLKMGRAAGVGLTVGVLSGVSSTTELTDHADLLLSSIHLLLQNKN